MSTKSGGTEVAESTAFASERTVNMNLKRKEELKYSPLSNNKQTHQVPWG